MYDMKNLIYIFTMLECIEKTWKNIAGLRDKISHNYRGVDADILWSVIYKDLEKLKMTLIDMVYIINPPHDLLESFLSTPHYKHIRYLL